MSLENILYINNNNNILQNDEFGNFYISKSKKIIEILNIEPCPNCGKDLYNGKCEDYKNCGYGRGEDYFLEYKKNKEKKELKNLLKSKQIQGNGKKYNIGIINGNKVFYFDYKNRILENRAHLTFGYDGKKYDMFVKFTIENKINYQDRNNYNIIKNIELVFPEKSYNKHKIFSNGKGVYFDFSIAKKIAHNILYNPKLNKKL